MTTTESAVPTDWFAQGDIDARAAEILLAAGETLPIAAFLIQQTIEKYLKGFLLSRGWTLRRVHDLELLMQEAIAHDDDFAPYLTSCQRITEYYIETRYPIAIFTPFQRETLEADLRTTRSLIALIRQKLFPPEANANS